MPKIREFSLSGFRGFVANQTLRPALPANGRYGLTILVGPNNSGKSSILEAIHLTAKGQQVKLGESHRNPPSKFMARLAISWDDGQETILQSDPTVKEQLKVIKTPPKPATNAVFQSVPVPPLIFVGPVRQYDANAENPDKDWMDHVSKHSQAWDRTSSKSPLLSRAATWDVEGSRFPALLKRITGYNIPIDTENNKLSAQIGNHRHGIDTLGLGIVSLFHIVNAIHDAPDGAIILIDEPETGLHPSYQRKVFDLLIEESNRLQIVYATQSPYMVDWEAILNGAVLARVHRPIDGYCQIDTLKPKTALDLASTREDQNNPHVLGTNALEVFFLQDGVILVEGQEDVVFYRRMAKNLGVELKYEFYGWGVGGASKMKNVAAVLHDLGYLRVVGILDADKANVREELETEFPKFSFLCIPTHDVRDRKPSHRMAADGLCDSSGNVHEHFKDAVEKLFHTVKLRLAAEGEVRSL